MRKFLQISIYLFVFLIQGVLLAQDVHFSQFHATPLQVNPAMTGVFDGKFRISNSYRTQWSGIGNGYKTLHIGMDLPVAKGLLSKNKFFGLGLLIYQDKAGTAALRNTIVEGSASFITALDEVGDHFLSLGFQGGLNQIGYDVQNASWDTQWNGDHFDPALPSMEDIQLPKFSYLDMNAGFLYYYVPDGFNMVSFGASLAHIGTPNISFFTEQEAELRQKVTIHGSSDLVLNLEKTTWIEPRFMMMFQGNQKEITFGGYLKNKVQFKSHYTNYRQDAYFYLGGFYRVNDAAIVSARFEYNSFAAGLSYDFNTSSLSSLAGSANAFEINLSYIIQVKRGERLKNFNKMSLFL